MAATSVNFVNELQRISSERDNFIKWLSDNNAKRYSQLDIVNCLDKVSVYAIRKKISKRSIWELSQSETFNPIYTRISKSILFRLFNYKLYKLFIVAGKMYISYLKQNTLIRSIDDASDDTDNDFIGDISKNICDEISGSVERNDFINPDSIKDESNINIADLSKKTAADECNKDQGSNKIEKTNNAKMNSFNGDEKMQAFPGTYSMPESSSNISDLLSPVLTNAFMTQPLLGNITLSDEQDDKLYALAVDVLSKARNKRNSKSLSDFDCDILVLKTVLFLRDWSGGSETGNDKNLWDYI